MSQFFLIIIFNIIAVAMLRVFASKIDLLDYPVRKKHPSATPLIGGLAIYLTLIGSVVIRQDWSSDFGKIVFLVTPVFLVAVIDDLRSVHWGIRLFVQSGTTIAALAMTGIEVSTLGHYPLVGEVHLGEMAFLFTLFAVLGITNAFNLIDGIDGLCGSLLIPFSVMAFSTFVYNGKVDFYLVLVVTSILIFLRFNLSNNTKKKIFMGDAGSCGLGFVVACSIISQWNNSPEILSPPLALWILLVPIMDTTHVVARRVFQGKSVFLPSADHLHNQIIQAGLSQKQALGMLSCVGLLGAGAGLLLNLCGDMISVGAFVMVVIFLPNLLIKHVARF